MKFFLNISEQLDSQPQQRFIKRPQLEVRFYLNPSIAYPLWKKKTDADACKCQVNSVLKHVCLQSIYDTTPSDLHTVPLRVYVGGVL